MLNGRTCVRTRVSNSWLTIIDARSRGLNSNIARSDFYKSIHILRGFVMMMSIENIN